MMMKNLKYLFLTLLGALAFVACTEDEREADWSGIKGNGVYFAMDAQTSYLLEENQTSLFVPVMRTFSQGALEVNVQFSDKEKTGIFAADSKARFADGSLEGKVEIVIDFKKVEYGRAYELALLILDDDQKSGYGVYEYNFTVKYDPWKTIGTALWRDDLLPMVLNVNPTETEVELQQSLGNANLYRLVDVYNPEYVASILGLSPADIEGSCTSHAIVFDLTDPNKVYIQESSMGLDVGYGEMLVASFVPENGFSGGNVYGTMVDNVITFPEQSLVMALPSMGSWYYSNLSGMTRIVMPGGVGTDPRVTAVYEGYMTTPDGDTRALFNVSMNADAASYRWAATNDITTQADLDAFVEGIKNGSVDSEKVNNDGEVSFLLDEPGTFYVAFVPYSEDGSVIGKATIVTFEYTTGSVTPSEFTVDVQTVDKDGNSTIGDTFVELTIVPNANNLLYYWDILAKSDYDTLVAEYGSIDAYMTLYFDQVATQNNVSVSDVVAVYGTKGTSAENYIDRIAHSTEYVVFAYCMNLSTGEARSPITEFVFSTSTPSYSDDFAAWFGTWTVQPTSLEDGSPADPFEIEISLKHSDMMYYVSGWGYGSVLPTYPVTMVYQVDETGSLVYIPEQLLDQIQVQNELPYVCFMARFYYEAQGNYFLYGGGVPAIIGGFTQSGPIMEPYQVQDENLGLIQFSGADYFLMYDDGGFGSESIPFAKGPYTLTRSASTSKMSVKSDKIETYKMTNKQVSMNPMGKKAMRAIHNAKYNCVVVR